LSTAVGRRQMPVRRLHMEEHSFERTHYTP
jgi:hypothetical protein